ncbi:MAG TPA: hypothetical protein VFV30_12245 [Novosphingobium sp.]|nr:hypothetical protein [Novosphingobium sp.]
MAVWDIDLTTRMGAREAARTASTAAFIYAGVNTLGLLILGGLVSTVGNYGQTMLNLAPVALVVLAIFAGFRLRDGKGLVLGGLLAVVVALGLLIQIASLAIGGGTAIGLVVLVLLVQGLRGAWALHRGTGFEDDDTAAFE